MRDNLTSDYSWNIFILILVDKIWQKLKWLGEKSTEVKNVV